MRLNLTCPFLLTICTIVCFAASSRIVAQEKRITYDHLEALGELAWRLRDYRDNEFVYEEKVDQLKSYARLLQGAELTFQVAVERVTKLEVVYSIADAGRTRVVICNDNPDLRPGTVLSRYRLYAGPKSAYRYNSLAAPTSFRIGDAIDAERAKQLRKDDVIDVKGVLKVAKSRIPADFRHDTIVYITDVKVVKPPEPIPLPIPPSL